MGVFALFGFFFFFWAIIFHGGLKENDPRRRVCLNIWSPGAGTVWDWAVRSGWRRTVIGVSEDLTPFPFCFLPHFLSLVSCLWIKCDQM